MHSRMLLPPSLVWLTCLIAQTATGQILEQNLELFQDANPGIRIYEQDDRVSMLYGSTVPKTWFPKT